MKVIKPSQLCVLTRPFNQDEQSWLAVAVIGFFPLGRPSLLFLDEAEQWPKALKALPKNKPLDEVFPKTRGEWLLAGSAYAPEGKPVQSLDVSIRVGDVSKTLRVRGDRRWYYGPWYRQTEALQFLSMPLTLERAYGGPRHPANPEGCGYTGNPLAGWIGRNEGALPNIERPERPVRGHVRKGEPVGLGPLDPSKPPRRRHAGNFGRRWQERKLQGMGLNMDPRFFQTAPEDQWASGPWQGGERYRLEHLHPQRPVIEGLLPDARARVLARTKDTGAVRAVDMAMDTVWFFPDHLLGVVVYHGKVAVSDPDALDVDAVLAAYEHPSATRSLSHYLQALADRTDPETAVLHAMSDAPLIPVESAQARALRQKTRQAKRAAAEEAQRQRREAHTQELGGSAHTTQKTQAAKAEAAPAGATAVAPTSPMADALGGPLDLEAVRSGDIDMAAWLANLKAKTGDMREQAQQSAREVLSVAVAHAQPVDLAKEKQRLYETASKPAWDLLDAQALTSTDDQQFIQGVDPQDLSKARAEFSRVQVLQRQARRAVLKPSSPALPTELSAWLGNLVRHWRGSGLALTGRDLAGADLRGVDFSGADLRETIFEACDLRGAKFSAADLRSASLVGARIAQADFSQARMEGANLSACDAQGARFAGADLRKAWAMAADLRECVLDDAVLDELLAQKLVLHGASLRRVSADRALLLELQGEGSRWDGAQLSTGNLLKAQLNGTSWRGARLKRCVLLDARLAHADLSEATLEKCLAIGASFEQARACGLRSLGSGWRGSVWTGADMSGAQCLSSDFGNVDFSGANLQEAVFAKCVLQGAKLHEVRGRDADFMRALCRRADFGGSDLQGSNFRQAALGLARFEDADLRGARLEKTARRKIQRENDKVTL
ncbi:DUF2169 domain-containing protein [Hylemonella sp. W303a]|uniref:DUF2169 family type VI secretion system accessory protein n=1 Tax=Hylemonella sp. W303a TaxID=3389873 RepID=UPI00396B1C3D